MGLKLYYHPYSTYSRRVLIALIEKQTPCEKVFVDMAAGKHREPAYKALNPYGRVPTLEEGDFRLYDQLSEPAVFAGVAKFTRVCAYDRPGAPVGEKPSRSDPVPQPTTAADTVADLHALLRAAGVAGPYVFAGHSYGGLVARLYASTYPEDVAGLVLVDALTEGLQDAETPAQWAIQRKLMEGDIRESLALYPALERNDPDRSFDQIRAAPPLRPLPLIVLSADRPWGPQVPSLIAAGVLPADVPPDFGYVTDAAQKQAQERLAKLVAKRFRAMVPARCSSAVAFKGTTGFCRDGP